jgi:hypothetical protein
MNNKKLIGMGVIFVLYLAACSTPSPEIADVVPQEQATQMPAETIPPTILPTPFPNPVAKVSGPEEIVFDWTVDRCEKENLPDLPTRAFRDSEGQVHLIISHYASYRMTGPSLNELEIDCNQIFSSDKDPDPSMFNDWEWIGSTYTEDGQTIYALIHNEYQGHTHPGKCPQGDYFPCWYNTVTLVKSTDSGQSFSHVNAPPDHLVAGLPYPYIAGDGPNGIRAPSNIIKGKDGFYYSYLAVAEANPNNQWVCLMRTDNLSDPKAWRFWNGVSFDGQFINPYLDAGESHKCPPLEWDDIGASLSDSITYNTYLNRYVLIGVSADHIDNREVWGYYYAFSDDLIHWTRRKLLVEITLPWRAENFDDVMYLYPSLLDPESESRNFDTVGKTGYLYYTRLNFGQGNLDRDLIRVPVEFFPSEAEAVIQEVTDIPKEAVSLSILNGPYEVENDTPVELTLIWEATTSEHVGNFLAIAEIEVSLDGAALPDAMNYWGEITESGERYASQWLYPIGTLDPGTHVVEIRIRLTQTVSDGLGNNYSGEILRNTIQIEVEE